MRNIEFVPKAFKEYSTWIATDRKTALKISDLIRDILRNPFEGLGKPEALKHQYKGLWFFPVICIINNFSPMLQIIQTADGSNTIFNSEIGENYHSKHGALQESQHVFLKSGLQYFLSIKEALAVFVTLK